MPLFLKGEEWVCYLKEASLLMVTFGCGECEGLRVSSTCVTMDF